MVVDNVVRRQVGWRLWDIVAVLIGPLVVAVGGTALLGLGRGRGAASRGLAEQLGANPIVVSMAATFAVYALFFAAIALVVQLRHLRWADVGLRRPPLLPVLLVPLLVVGQLFAVAITNVAVSAALGNFQNPQIEALTGGQTTLGWNTFWPTLFVVGMVAPFVEELIFRGLLFGWLRAHMPVAVAIVASAALFGVAHVIPQLFPALFIVGLILALVYQWTGSLWITMLLHAAQNSIAVIAIWTLLPLLPKQ